MVGWFLALGILSTVAAAPSILFPVNSQVPPVARVSKAFQFTFAVSTFFSNAPNIRYTLSSGPAWLQLDSDSRSLFGTPGLQDVGPAMFSLVASDESGITNMPVTLIVSPTAGPALGRPVADQLSAFGSFSPPEDLILSYSNSISLSFSPDTFTGIDQNTVYYAICANNTPLPSWINFDSTSLAFSGITPQPTSPVELSQIYDIRFTASDVVGFAGATASFRLIVENHVFSFNSVPHRINFSPGDSINYSGLLPSLTLDGRSVKHTDLSQIEANAPSWILLDRNTLTLSGIAPTAVESFNVSISATDQYGDEAGTTVCFQTTGNTTAEFFYTPLSPAKATIGTHFVYSLADALNTDPDMRVSVDLSGAAWMNFDPASRVLQGNVPNSLAPGQVVLNFTVIEGTQSQSQGLAISIVRPGTGIKTVTTGGASSTTGSDSPAATGDGHTATTNLTANHARRKTWIAIAVVLPLLAAIALLMLLCWCWRRRRRPKEAPSKDQISKPQPMSWFRRASDLPMFETAHRRNPPDHRTIAEVLNSDRRGSPTNSETGTVLHEKRASSKAPKLGFFRLSPSRWSGLGVLPETDGASMHHDREAPYSLAPEDQEKLVQSATPTPRKRRSSRLLEGPMVFEETAFQRFTARRKRQSTRSSNSTNNPFSSRISGFGHGRNGFSRGSSLARGRSVKGFGHGSGGPPGHGLIRNSWRSNEWSTTGSSSSRHFGSELSQKTSSNVQWPRPPTSATQNLNPFPLTQPPIAEASDDESGDRPTIRRVFSTSQDPWAARQDYIESRARNRTRDNALFSANPSSRVTSQLLQSKSLRNTYTSKLSKGRTSSPPRTTSKENTSPISRTQSSSSSISSHLKPPLPLRSRRSRNLLTSAVRVISPRRFRSNNSLRSSAFGDAESSSDIDLREEIDELGRKRWRHVEYPNPLASNSTDDISRGGMTDTGDKDVEALFAAGQGTKAARLSRLVEREEERGRRMEEQARSGREDSSGNGGLQRRAVLGSHRAKRPVSVPGRVGLEGGGKSFSGEFGAFL